MRQAATSTMQSKLFNCAKCSSPIAHVGGLVHDALIQTALDPTIQTIKRWERANSSPPQLNDEIIIEMTGARFHLDIEVPSRHRTSAEAIELECTLRRHEIFSLRVTGADITREPGFSNARLVWSARNALIAPDIQLRALRTLTKGPMSLEALCTMLTGVPNPMAIILALACRDLVELDLFSAALSPHTFVRIRRTFHNYHCYKFGPQHDQDRPDTYSGERAETLVCDVKKIQHSVKSN